MMRLLKYIPLWFLVLISCITPLDIDNEREETILVVEGFISTLPGPYNIRITSSAKYGSVFEGQIRPETDAEVWIRDNEGNTTFLTDVAENGNYQTPPGFRGEIGKTYVLNIRNRQGVNYASIPETLVEVPDIDSIYYEFIKIPTENPDEFESGIEVYGVFNDPGEERNYYMWRNSGTYYIQTFPENYLIPGPAPRVNAPKSCCRDCWITELNGDFTIRILNDINTDGQRNNELVAYLQDDGDRFTQRYQINILQLSISKEAFGFFNLLKNQKSIDGDIFDPPPATVRGNIINLDDPSQNVIGYFHASDAKIISGFIERDQLEEFQPNVAFNDDCRVIEGATAERPADWD